VWGRVKENMDERRDGAWILEASGGGTGSMSTLVLSE